MEETKICPYCKKEFQRTNELDHTWSIKKFCCYKHNSAYLNKKHNGLREQQIFIIKEVAQCKN